MIRPLIEVHDENSSGPGLELVITRRWSHFGFWLKGRGIDIYTGEIAEDFRAIMEREE